MIGSAVNFQRQRQFASARGEAVRDIDVDDMANYVQDLEVQGMDVAEGSLCEWAIDGSAPRFCRFIVNSNEVQWVNNVLVHLPIVAQVTHQIATVAAGAADFVQDVVKSSMKLVVDAVNAVEDVVHAATQAATNIVHSVLHFFHFADSIVRRSIYASVGMRFDIGNLAIEHKVV